MLKVDKIRPFKPFVLVPVAVALAVLGLIQGLAYFSSSHLLAKINYPLITFTSFSAAGDHIVYTQKYFNRVQLYGPDANFISGFSLRGSSSAFRIAIMENGALLDCTPKLKQSPAYEVYSLDGKRSEIAVSEQTVALCNELEDQKRLSNGSTVSVEKNLLGYRLQLNSSSNEALLYSSQPIVPYIVANLLYLPVASGLSVLLLLASFAHWLYSRKGNDYDCNVSPD
ncbi:MAG: hypothetical protein AAF720_15575 [Pseudomonadota bacterium]